MLQNSLFSVIETLKGVRNLFSKFQKYILKIILFLRIINALPNSKVLRVLFSDFLSLISFRCLFYNCQGNLMLRKSRFILQIQLTRIQNNLLKAPNSSFFSKYRPFLRATKTCSLIKIVQSHFMTLNNIFS